MDLHLDLGGDGPLRVRFEHALRAAVRRLPAGTRLPPTRTLASELTVSRGIVVEAYAQLAAEGYLTTRRGGGTLVAGAGAAMRDEAAQTSAASARGEAAATHGGEAAAARDGEAA